MFSHLSRPNRAPQVPGESFEEYVRVLGGLVCDSSPENETAVMANELCRRLIYNDGRQTYVVHSTTPKLAEVIMQEGLASTGMRDGRQPFDPDMRNWKWVPKFGRTVVRLAGPKENDRARFNTHALAYEYKQGEGNVAKVVLSFPVPHDGQPYHHTFGLNRTFLGEADGTMVVQDPPVDGIKDTFRLPAQFAMGYFDLQAKEFVTNDSFTGPMPANV